METPRFEAPEFVEVATGDRVALVPFEEAIANPAVSAQVVNKALTDIDNWVRGYGAFLERIGDNDALEIVKAIEGVKSKMGNNWPTLYEDDGEGGMLIADED